MKLHFYKYQGTGNDFIMVDDRRNTFPIQNQKLIQRLCERRFGIGSDGMILIRNHHETDFEMLYFNADGKRGSMCGNGGRCAVKFAQYLGIIQNEVSFMAFDGEHEASIENDIVHLKMNDVYHIEVHDDFYFLNTGSPHYVSFCQDLTNKKVYEEGKAIRYQERFAKEGTNVNFVEILDKTTIYVRTYERGVEDETLSCGTGVTASALVVSLKGAGNVISVKTLGGDLQVRMERKEESWASIFLSGKAEKVYEGTIEI